MMTNSEKIDVDDHEVSDGVFLIGEAIRQPDGSWRCLANYYGAMWSVEIKFGVRVVESPKS